MCQGCIASCAEPLCRVEAVDWSNNWKSTVIFNIPLHLRLSINYASALTVTEKNTRAGHALSRLSHVQFFAPISYAAI